MPLVAIGVLAAAAVSVDVLDRSDLALVVVGFGIVVEAVFWFLWPGAEADPEGDDHDDAPGGGVRRR